MKLFKILTLIFASISLIACGSDDDSGPSFELTAESILGTYVMTSANIETERVLQEDDDSTTDLDITLEEGVDFQSAELVLANDTFSASGIYLQDVTIDGKEVDKNMAITITSVGTYTLDVENEIITFLTSEESVNTLLEGEYSILKIAENVLTIEQELTSTNGQIDSTVNSSFSFNR